MTTARNIRDSLNIAFDAVSDLGQEELEVLSAVVELEIKRRTSSIPPAPAPAQAAFDVEPGTDTRPTAMYRSRGSQPPPRITAAELADKIFEREGFRVAIVGAGPTTFLRPFAFERRMRGGCTVQQWRAIRFARLYPGITAHVYLADGQEARGTHRLETVRGTYQTSALQTEEHA